MNTNTEWICPYCGHANASNARFCGECGKQHIETVPIVEEKQQNGPKMVLPPLLIKIAFALYIVIRIISIISVYIEVNMPRFQY